MFLSETGLSSAAPGPTRPDDSAGNDNAGQCPAS